MSDDVPVRVELGMIQNTSAGLGVNVRGTVIAATWVGGYVPTLGDSVTVLVVNGHAYILGHVHTAARPLVGTVAGAPSNGVVAVSTDSGVIQCRYVGTPPASGSLVRLDWQSSTPWIWPSAAAATPSGGGGGGDTPTPPAPRTSGTETIGAMQSSTWGSASGWNRYGSEVRQWRFGSEADSRGAWFYGAQATRLAGATITAARIFLPARVRIGSYNSGTVAHLYRHTSQTMPGGDVNRVAGPHDVSLPANWGGDWVGIPASWGQAMIADGGGIGIYGAPYMGFVGLPGQSGQLQLDWER